MSILFDLDGTLLDTAPDFLWAINQVRTQENLNPVEMKQIRSAISYGAKAILKAGFNQTSNPMSENAFEELYERFLKTYANCSGTYAEFFPGMASLLSYLEQNQIDWGIVTNKKTAFSHPLLEKLNLKSRAVCVVSGDTLAYQKPHPAPLLHACEIMQIAPNQCLYIGDAKSDIEAGKAAGMKTIAALFGYIDDLEAAKTWGADYYVDSADQILPWYQSWQSTR